MLILNCVYKSREINIGFLEFSSCIDSSKFWQSHSLIYMLIEIPHQNMYNDIVQRHYHLIVQLLSTKIVQISDTSMKLSEITKGPKGNIFWCRAKPN